MYALVLLMLVLFRELCLLNGLSTTPLVGSFSTAVLGAGAVTIIGSSGSSSGTWLQIVVTDEGGMVACVSDGGGRVAQIYESAFPGVEATPVFTSSPHVCHLSLGPIRSPTLHAPVGTDQAFAPLPRESSFSP